VKKKTDGKSSWCCQTPEGDHVLDDSKITNDNDNNFGPVVSSSTLSGTEDRTKACFKLFVAVTGVQKVESSAVLRKC
jgi:hypothetical protein